VEVQMQHTYRIVWENSGWRCENTHELGGMGGEKRYRKDEKEECEDSYAVSCECETLRVEWAGSSEVGLQ
jgi:hypothetical protein